MTRLAILADIHGNLPALEAVRRDLAGEQVDRIVVAGDSINWGPSSAEVVDIIAREGWAVIRGNNEYYLLDYLTPRAPEAWTAEDFPVLPLLREQLAGNRHAIVATWPDTLSLRFPNAPALRVVHGSPRDHSEAMRPNQPEHELAVILADVEEPYVVAGHTHLPMDRTVDGRRVLNPGSVGLPLDGTFDAQYTLLDGDAAGWHAQWRRVPYDRAPLFEAFERQQFVERCGAVGALIVEEFRTARIHLHAFVRWRDEHRPGCPLAWELLDEFRKVDRWQYTDASYRVNLDMGRRSGGRKEG